MERATRSCTRAPRSAHAPSARRSPRGGRPGSGALVRSSRLLRSDRRGDAWGRCASIAELARTAIEGRPRAPRGEPPARAARGLRRRGCGRPPPRRGANCRSTRYRGRTRERAARSSRSSPHEPSQEARCRRKPWASPRLVVSCGRRLREHSPLPQLRSPLAELARFCGQCGTTIASSGAPDAAAPVVHMPEPANVHEEVTVARPKIDLAAIKTIMDAAPFGRRGGAASCTCDPRPERPRAAATSRRRRCSARRWPIPRPQERAIAMREAALAEASTAQAPPLAPKANLHKTMMMGGDPMRQVAAPSDRPRLRPSRAPRAHSRTAFSSRSRGTRPRSPPTRCPRTCAGRGTCARSCRRSRAGPPRSGSPPAGRRHGRGRASNDARHAGDRPRAASRAPAAEPLGGTVPLGGPPAHVLAPGAAAPPNAAHKTMLGVAIPGIAPTHARRRAHDERRAGNAGGPRRTRS